MRAEAEAAAAAAQARHASASVAAGPSSAAVAASIPRRYLLPTGGADAPAAGERAGEQTPARLASLCEKLQGLCKDGLALAEAMPEGTRMRRVGQFEAYTVGVNGVAATILRVEQVLARLHLGASGAAAAPPPGQLGIAPGAAAGWGIGRFGVASLGDKGTTKLPPRPPPPPPPPPKPKPGPNDPNRAAPVLQQVALNPGRRGKKKGTSGA